jgi:hypothetical protein
MVLAIEEDASLEVATKGWSLVSELVFTVDPSSSPFREMAVNIPGSASSANEDSTSSDRARFDSSSGTAEWSRLSGGLLDPPGSVALESAPLSGGAGASSHRARFDSSSGPDEWSRLSWGLFARLDPPGSAVRSTSLPVGAGVLESASSSGGASASSDRAALTPYPLHANAVA